MIGPALAVVSALAAMLSGLGSRWEWWNFRTGFTILKWSAYAGLAAAVLSLLIGGWKLRKGRGGTFPMALGIFLGLAIFVIPWAWLRIAKRLPAIHDITTDVQTPPSFVKILALRKGAPNPAEYGGPAIAAKQRAAYPDIAPLILEIPPAQAFGKALTAARAMGWKIADSSPAEGRIEATATTFWFGFKDDVVIRIAPSGAASRIDARSVSRVGRGDIGTNARRIRRFLLRVAA